MAEHKGSEHDTTPETPQSKHTMAVRTGRSDPPPPPGVPAIRPAAGSPPPTGSEANPRAAKTLPRAVKVPAGAPRGANAMWVGAAVLMLLVSVIVMLTLHRPTP